MAELKWHDQDSRRYISGVSNGVFYGDDGKGVAWNGLISVTEKSQVNEPTPVHNSLGQKYDLHGNVAEKRHSIVCYTYPEEMDEYLGFEFLDEFGFMVDERPPKKFNMVYRNECDGYYELHILLGQIATFGDKVHTTDGVNVGVSTIPLNLQGVPHEVYGSSHLILDSRNPITASAERFLYGTQYADANFEDFLNAEVQWVTQAINYAPTLEPDYDNRVWVGLPPDLIQHNDEYDEPVWANGAEEVFDDLPPDGGRVWMADESIGSRPSHSHSGLPVVPGLPYRLSFWAKASVDGSRIYLTLMDQTNTLAVDSGTIGSASRYLVGRLDLMTEWTKYESVVTLNEGVEEVHLTTTYWNHTSGSANAKQYLSDVKLEPAYDLYVNPNPGEFHPNHVPGIKNASKWNSTNVVPYWDEVTEQLALHSVSPEEWAQSKVSIPLDVSTPVDLKTSADINFGGMVDEVVGENLILDSTNFEFSTSDNHSRTDRTQIGRIEVLETGGWNAYRWFTDHLGSDNFLDGRSTYTFSIDLKVTAPSGGSVGFRWDVRVDQSPTLSPMAELADTDGQWVRVSTTMTLPNRGETRGLLSLRSVSPTDVGDVIEYRNLKVERGSVPTAWSPAPADALHRRIIGTREPQVLSEQAPNVIGSQKVTLNSTVHDNPQVDIYHNGPSGSDDVRVDNLMVVLQNYRGGFFDGNTVPKTRGERYRRVDCTTGYHTVYEHLQFVTQSEIELRTIGPDLYELTGPTTHLQPSNDGDQFTFIGPQATTIDDDTFEIDDNILGF